MPNENLDTDSGETPLPKLKPPVVQSKAVKPLIYTVGILLVFTFALTYYAFHMRDKHAVVEDQRDGFEKKLKATSATHESCERDLKTKREIAAKLPACERKAKELSVDLGMAIKKKKALEESGKATKRELVELRKARDRQERRLKTFRNLMAKFQKMIDSGKIDVLVRDGNMIVKLPAGVLFAVARADLSKKGRQALVDVGAVLKKMDKRWLIVGHTDNQPLRSKDYKGNWELSTARALTVTRFLIDTVGMKAANLIAAGRGEFDPVASNNSRRGRQKNRRIEIILMPDLGDMPELPHDLKKGKKRKKRKGGK